MTKITEITTFKQIKEIIEPIPSDKFCTDDFENNRGQCCLFGHINKSFEKHPDYDFDGFGARQLTIHFIKEVHNMSRDGSSVNNGTSIYSYKEPIIKDRLMHMIEDGIKWENSK